jgi:hypothetical protein
LAKYSHDTADGEDEATEKSPHWRVERDPQRRCGVAAAASPDQDQQLQQPGDAHRGRDRQRRKSCIASPAEQGDHDRDQRHVEQQRRERRQREARLGVQQRHHHRDRPGEGEIGQHQAGIVNGELQRLVPGKPRRQRGNHQRHQQADQGGRHQPCRADRAEHAACERGGGLGALGLAHAHPRRHQCRVQRALGQQPSHYIDQLKRQQERVRDRARAEQRGHHRIACESHQP